MFFSVRTVTVSSFSSLFDLPNSAQQQQQQHQQTPWPCWLKIATEPEFTCRPWLNVSASFRLDRRTKAHSHYQQRPTLLPTFWRSTSHQQVPELHLGSSCTTSCQRYLMPRARVRLSESTSRQQCPSLLLRLSLNTIAPAVFVSHAPVLEYIAPAVSHGIPAPVYENIAPAPPVTSTLVFSGKCCQDELRGHGSSHRENPSA